MRNLFELEENPVGKLVYETWHIDFPEGRQRISYFEQEYQAIKYANRNDAQVIARFVFENGAPYKILRYANKKNIGKPVKRKISL